MEYVCWMALGLFWRKSMLHSYFIVLVNKVSISKLFELILYKYISLFKYSSIIITYLNIFISTTIFLIYILVNFSVSLFISVSVYAYHCIFIQIYPRHCLSVFIYSYLPQFFKVHSSSYLHIFFMSVTVFAYQCISA